MVLVLVLVLAMELSGAVARVVASVFWALLPCCTSLDSAGGAKRRLWLRLGLALGLALELEWGQGQGLCSEGSPQRSDRSDRAVVHGL